MRRTGLIGQRDASSHGPYCGGMQQGYRPVVVSAKEGLSVQISDIADLADGLTGVRKTQTAGVAQWRYQGRLVARQLDNAHVAIRADFDDRDEIPREFPETLSVPTRPPSTRWSSQTWPTTIRQPSRMPSKPPGASSKAATEMDAR